MSNEVEIRESLQSDIAAIESLYPEAFPDEDLLPVVRDLLQDPAITTSLVGLVETAVVGHAIFTYCGVAQSDVKAARAAGFRIICMSYGYNHGEDIRVYNPDLVIDSMAELKNYL